MRKLLPSVILLLISSTFVNAQSSDKQDMRLTGPVRFVREEMVRLENHAGQLTEGPRLLIQSIAFDKQGNITEQTVNRPDGSLSWKLGWERTYDSEGKIIQKAHYNAEGAFTAVGLYAYDDSGKKLKMTRYNPDGFVNFYLEYIYDEKGKIKEEYERKEDGSPRAHIVYAYDDRGRQAERVHYNPDETLSARFIFTYDEHGNIVSFTESVSPAAILFQQTYKYDSKGNLVKQVFYGNAKERIKDVFSSFEFDRPGNWIKRRTVREVIRNGNKQVENEITYRTITYY